MKLTYVIEVWDKLHKKDTGEIIYADLEKAIEEVVGVENDVSLYQPQVSDKETV
jgi:hypothetical protein